MGSMNTAAVFSLVISLCGIIVIVMGWLINKIWSDSKSNNDRVYQQIDKLDTSNNKLANSITGLNGTILAQAEKISSSDKACELKHGSVVQRLETHEKRLNKHSDEIDELKEKVK